MDTSPNQYKWQACDACKRRKVRCRQNPDTQPGSISDDGSVIQASCQQCDHFNIPCVYTPIVRGRPRKGAASRGSVIQECRDNQSSQPQIDPPRKRLKVENSTSFTIPGLPMGYEIPTANFFLSFVEDYMTAVYPVNPIIDEAEIRDLAANPTRDSETTSFLYAYAALTTHLTRTDGMNCSPQVKEQIRSLLTQTFDYLDPMAFDSQPTTLKVTRNIFIEICLLALNEMDLAFFYLREAISMLQILGVRSGASATLDQNPEKAKLQRAYWECFIHERFNALSDYKPTCLRPLSTLPDHDPSLPPRIEVGWNQLIKTFSLVDETFIDYWTGDRMRISSEWIRKKHQELEDGQWQVEIQVLDEMQQADLIITRQWLQTLLWQMALSNLLLSSNPKSEMESPSLMLPLRLSTQLRQFLSQMTPQSIGIHGTGVLHKLFDITATITDVVIHIPSASRSEVLDRADDVLFLKYFIFSFPRIQDEHRAALTQKVQVIMEKYPEIVAYEQENYGSPIIA